MVLLLKMVFKGHNSCFNCTLYIQGAVETLYLSGGTMGYLIGFIVALISATLTYINLDEKISGKIKILNKHKDNCPEITISKMRIYILTGIIFIASFAACISIFMNVSDILNIVKMNISLVCLTGAAAMDYREHRIPNIYPLILAICSIVCLGIGYFSNQAGATSYIVSSVIATVGVAICLLLAKVLTKQGIGLGDIKLLCALALMGGVYAICGTIFFAMTVCAVLAVVLLATRKKNMQSSLPFGPFILMGYLITIFVSIY